MLRFFRLTLFILLCSTTLFSQSREEVILIDSIVALRKQSRSIDNYEEQVRLAKAACRMSNTLDIDSTRFKSNQNLSSIYLNYDVYDEFGTINLENKEIAEQLKDTSYLATVHYNLGYYSRRNMKNDSAFYYYSRAVKFYQHLEKPQEQAGVLLNMANIQEAERDYFGSQQNAVQAIKIVQKLPKNDYNYDTLFWLYNILAVVESRIGKYKEAIEYYDKALEVGNQIQESLFYYINANNNKAYALEQMGNYKEAIYIYESLLNDQGLRDYDSEMYIIIKGNLAYAKHLSGDYKNSEVKNDFLDAYRYGREVDDQVGLVTIGNYMSEFYLSQQQQDTAKLIAGRTLKLAEESSAYAELLRSLKLLSEMETGDAGKAYLERYIQLNDSLVTHERSIRNKFAKVEFETDQLKAENQQISRERLIFLISSISLAILLFLIYTVITQRSKNQELRFIQQQQEANEEIYNLMLAQQDKMEEGRTQEKKRISEELHDGILGKLFGTRLSLDSLNMIATDEAAKSRNVYINELKAIESEIRKISHDLNNDFVSDSGFMDILGTLVEKQTKAYDLTYSFDEKEEIDWDEVSNRTKIHIYRMLQESLQNIYKHAEANHVKISFSLKNDVILLAIEDNGIGFNVNKARKGIGLKNIDSRVREIGGRAEIFSKINTGTIIKISIPT